jgi:hypothetical protein
MAAVSSPRFGSISAWFSPADRLVLRLAFAGVLGFAIALSLHWEFCFLAPMLAVQIVAAMPVCPNVRQGVTIPLVIFLATTTAMAAATLLADAPTVLLLVVGLVLCWTFYGQRRGAPAVAMLLIQVSFAAVPLFSTLSLDTAQTFAEFMQKSSVAAIIAVWVSHALFPAPRPVSQASGPAPKPAGLEPARAARVAITDVLVLLPLLAKFMIWSDVDDFVILMITINLLREVETVRTGKVAVALLTGNLLGGVVALVAQQYILVADNLIQFLLTIFLAGLWFGGRMVRGGPMAPVFVLAFATFLLLIGIAITPLPGGSEEAFVLRIIKVGLASLYALAALSLVTRLRGGADR